MAVRDVVFIGVILFVIAIGFFVIKFTSDTIVSKMVSIPMINQSQDTVNSLTGMQSKVNNRLDYLFLGLFIGLTLALIITGWFIGGQPIFAFIYTIIVVVSVILSTVFASTWQSITQASIFGTTVSTMPITNHILSWLPLYVAIIGFIGLIVMFAKPSLQGE